MKERWYYVVMIIVLLFVQAYCDLSLPDYTSKIVNVGIQQKGIEDGVPDTIRKESMEHLLLFLDEKEKAEVEDAYTLKDDVYKRNDVTKEERDELNSILAIPMMVAGSLEDEEKAAEIKTQMGLPEESDLWQVLEQLPQEQLDAIATVYTAIPRVNADGVYGPATAASVREFQSIFGLPQTGVVDFATWYKISHIYVGVSGIGELYGA